MDIKKEILKNFVDAQPNYTEKQKYDIKAIIQFSNTEHEIIERLLEYLNLTN